MKRMKQNEKRRQRGRAARSTIRSSVKTARAALATKSPESKAAVVEAIRTLDQAVSRGIAYAPYADLVWCETGKPDLKFARQFAEAIHAKYPGKLLAYNCSPSFNWKKNLDDATIAKFQREIAGYGYKFQFITLAGFHALNYSMFNLAHGYARRQMSAFVELQEAEFAAADLGFTAVKHQREVGTGYFDAVTQAIQGAQSSTVALKGSTEEAQFHGETRPAAA